MKLFIGGIPIDMPDESLKEYFGEFGSVIECHSLPPKNNNPQQNTKAAFVRFSRKSEAMAAIDACDKKRSFDGIERTMDVRIAEGTQEKPVHGGGPIPSNIPSGGRYQASSQYRQVAPTNLPIPAPPQPMRQPRSIGAWTEFYTGDGRPYYHNAVTNTTSWDAPAEFRAANYPITAHYLMPHVPHAGPVGHSAAGTGDSKGPSGANLFVFHVPTEWSDADLYQHFSPYGNLLSFRIAREKETNRPKGFGFVSYDNPSSASAAVAGLNGFLVSNGKRLKVSVKKGEDGYTGPMGGRMMSQTSHYSPY